MRPFLTLFYTLLSGLAIAQSGFSNKILLPDAESCTFASIVIDRDTIVCWGDVYGTDQQKWGVCLAKFDTLGNLIQMTTDFDSTEQQTVDPTCQITRTSDGGYLGVSSQGEGKKTAAYKFSHTGALEWKHFYREPNFQVAIAYSSEEVSDGYLCFGWYSINNDAEKFIMKLSKAGELLWYNKQLSISGLNDGVFGRHVKTGNNILLGCSLAPNSGFDVWAKAVLTEVDSTGNLVWEWESQISDRETGITAVTLSPDSNIVYSVSRYFINALNGYSAKLKFRCINPQTGNTVWQTELPSFELGLESSSIVDGSGFDAIGYHGHWYEGFVVQGILAHYDWNGNLLWQRYDTVHVDTGLVVSRNRLYNMAHLSSGSIIGVGYIERSDPYQHLEGWLIKWSANGCLEESDCAVVSTQQDLSNNGAEGWKNWEVYPNPATDHTWFYPPEPGSYPTGVLQITNVSGGVVHRQLFDQTAADPYKVSLTTLPDGLYFYQITVDGAVQKVGRLVVLGR